MGGPRRPNAERMVQGMDAILGNQASVKKKEPQEEKKSAPKMKLDINIVEHKPREKPKEEEPAVQTQMEKPKEAVPVRTQPEKPKEATPVRAQPEKPAQPLPKEPVQTQPVAPQQESRSGVKGVGKVVKRLEKTSVQKIIDSRIDRLLGGIEPAQNPEYMLVRTSTGECMDVKGSITIGKDETCDFVVSDNTTVSRLHAQMEIQNGALMVKDMSMNGTYVAGKRLPKNQMCEITEGNIVFSNEKFQVKRK